MTKHHEINTPNGPAVPSPYGDIMINDLLDVDVEAGTARWKIRPRELFLGYRHWKMWNARYAGTVVGCANSEGYLHAGFFGRMYKLHRIIFAISMGEWPSETVDHKNGVRDDNRVVNLRNVSQAANCRNQKMPNTNTSGAVGVFWDKGRDKWRVRICVNSIQQHIGMFKTFEEAAAARAAASIKHGYHINHGRRAR